MKKNHYIEGDKDVANDIYPLIEKGILLVNTKEEEEKFIALIEKNFNFVGSKISLDFLSSMLDHIELNKLSREQIKTEIRKQILKEAQLFDLLDETFAIIGDNYMDYSYKGRLLEIIHYITIFIDLPQHTYFVSENGKFVFCYTMVGDFLFYIAK